jgi:hypothetical protein
VWIVIDFFKEVPTCHLDPVRNVSEVTGRFYPGMTQGSSASHKHMFTFTGLVYLDMYGK